MKWSRIRSLFLLPLLWGVAACSGGAAPDLQRSVLPDASLSDPINGADSDRGKDSSPPSVNSPGIPIVSAPSPEVSIVPSPRVSPSGISRSYKTAVLLFNGTGVSTSDWQNTGLILRSMGLSYQLVNSAQMNAMSLDALSQFGAIVVPGGLGGTIYSNLTQATRLRIRQAVRDVGVGYVGFCAGAWVAVGLESDTNNVASYGFAVAEGEILEYWYPNGNTSAVADMAEVTFPDGSKRSLVWWGGPATPEWKNGVIARYDNGAPAISQTFSGKGFVVIAGPHPEAPQSWRATAGNDPDGLDYDIAQTMFRAAIEQKPMPVY